LNQLALSWIKKLQQPVSRNYNQDSTRFR
jgi:hypothetical protein